MPAPSPDRGVMPQPEADSLFAAPDDLATQISEIADGDARALDLLHEADPDQVDGPVARKRLGPLFWIATGWVALVVAAAVLAPVLPLDDPAAPVGRPRLAPSANHWFGTDMIGRDIFSRVIWGARVSLVVGVASIILGLLVGGTIGLVAGYVKGRTETVLMGVVDVLLAFPSLLLALAIVTFRDDRSVTNVVLALGVVSIAPIARLVRASTLVFSEREFVTASRSIGASHLRTITREILPNVVLPVVSFSVIGIAVAIVAEGGLAFLGLSVDDEVTWGGMINDGRSQLTAGHPYMSMIPATAMFLTVLALNLAGDRLREHFDLRDGAL